MGQGCSVDAALPIAKGALPAGTPSARETPAVARIPPEARAAGSLPVDASSWGKSATSEQDPRYSLRACRFATERWQSSDALCEGSLGIGWRRWYQQGPELGRGVSAKVFEARASGGDLFGCVGARSSLALEACHASCGAVVVGSGDAASSKACGSATSGRRVAVKVFKSFGKDSYNLERAALARVGVHPNVVRLFESYRDPRCGGEDVLVHEFCNGPSLWDLFSEHKKRHRELLSELLVARVAKQLFQALDHLVACGVEHQDVKPENMFLFGVCLAQDRAHVKLGDFGWSTAGPWLASRALPPAGVGSLWYAAPELNPPVKGLDLKFDHLPSTRSTACGSREPEGLGGSDRTTLSRPSGGQAQQPLPPSTAPPGGECASPRTAAGLCSLHFACGGASESSCREPEGGCCEPIPGRSDVWSAGVVLYVLLVGTNPFAAARRAPTHSAQEQEVLWLVAQGKFDTTSRHWQGLPPDAKALLGACLQVNPALRPCASAAFQSGWIPREVAQASATGSSELGAFVAESVQAAAVVEEAKETWRALSGLRRLAWGAVARAVSEPELRPEVVAAALEASSSPKEAVEPRSRYLWQLAILLAASPADAWLQDSSAWPEIMRLAFCYLDVDGDGALSAEDLSEHLGDGCPDAIGTVRRWIAQLSVECGLGGRDAVFAPSQLVPDDFRRLLVPGPPPAVAYPTA